MSSTLSIFTGALEWPVRTLLGDCVCDGHDGEWQVVDINGMVRTVEFSCDRCGATWQEDEPAGEPHYNTVSLFR